MRIILLIMLLYALSVQTPHAAHAQIEKSIPYDLLFTAADHSTSRPGERSFIARYDAQMRKAVPFYRSPDWNVDSLRWSPKGDQVAVLFSRYDTDTPFGLARLCILTRTGTLITCLAEEPPYFLTAGNNGYGYNVTWSADGEKLYFINLIEDMYRLVEADAQTGHTLRVVYQLKNTFPNFVLFSWTRQLDSLLVGVDAGLQNGTALLIRMPPVGSQPTGAPLELFTANSFSSTLPDDSFNGRQQHFWMPCAFSPLGNYIPLRDLWGMDFGNALTFALLSKDGTKHLQFPNSSAVFPQNCPSWTTDEQKLYFTHYTYNKEAQVQTARIYKYMLATASLIPFNTDPPPALVIDGPLIVSPDGQYLAFDTYFNPAYNELEPPRAPRIGVVGPNNSVYYVSEPYIIAAHPLWVPPLEQ